MKSRPPEFVFCAENAFMFPAKTHREPPVIRNALSHAWREPGAWAMTLAGRAIAHGRHEADPGGGLLRLPARQAPAAAQAHENMAKCCQFVSWLNKWTSDGSGAQLCGLAQPLPRSADLDRAAPWQQWIRSDGVIPVRRNRRGDSICTRVARQISQAGRVRRSLHPPHPPYPACGSRARPGVSIQIES